jgi:predicted nucleotidyltransferase
MQLETSPEISQLLSDLVAECTDLLGDNLVGIYLHGSLAMGCFNPDSSDVDFLVVSSDRLTPEKRRETAKAMLRLSEHAPPKGLEMSVITERELLDVKHPTPFEFHFSTAWIEQYRNDTFDYSRDNLVDGDLAAHLTIIKVRGIVLYGQAIDALFPDIPEHYYRDSILGDAREILENLSSTTSYPSDWSTPVYNVLNLCRVRTYLEAGLITSKREGGEWALLQATPFQAALIRQALAEYTQSQKEEWNQEALQRFGQEMSESLTLYGAPLLPTHES